MLPSCCACYQATFIMLSHRETTTYGKYLQQCEKREVGPFHYLLTNFDLVMSFGAEAAFDYRESHCATKVSGVANFRFSRALDTISSKESAQMCADVLKEGSDAASTSILPIDSLVARSSPSHCFFGARLERRYTLWATICLPCRKI
jgi:hypothetical protein